MQETAEKRERIGFAGGIVCGIVSAIAFGSCPLFARRLYQLGFDVDSVLFFRFLPAALCLGVLTLLRGEGLRLSLREALQCLIAGLLFCATSLTIFLSYRDMDIGIAATLFFLYPVFVVLVSAGLFREKMSFHVFFSLFFAFAGVALLSIAGSVSKFSGTGFFLAVLSAVCYAGYQLWIARSGCRKLPVCKLAFYVVLVCLLFYWVRLRFGFAACWDFSPQTLGNIAGVAMVGALLAMGLSAFALQRCGATITAVLGSLEPLTAILLGVLLFQEGLSARKLCGVILVLLAVICIILRRKASSR